MLEVKVVITFAPEVINLLGNLIKGTKVVPEVPVRAEKEQIQAPKKQIQDEKEQTNETEPSVTIEEIRALAAKVIKKDRKKAKQILDEFGANSVSTLDKEHYDAFYEKIGELA